MVGLAAQVSLYPLRQETLSPAIDAALQIFHENDFRGRASVNRLQTTSCAGQFVVTGACPRARNEAAFLLTSLH
jgi:hypothetical protein